MKYHVSRDVGHLKFTTIKDQKSPFQAPCMTNNLTLARYSNTDGLYPISERFYQMFTLRAAII